MRLIAFLCFAWSLFFIGLSEAHSQELISDEALSASSNVNSGGYPGMASWVRGAEFAGDDLVFMSEAYDDLKPVPWQDENVDLDLFLHSLDSGSAEIVSDFYSQNVVGFDVASNFLVEIREQFGEPNLREIWYRSRTSSAEWGSATRLIIQGYDQFGFVDVERHKDTVFSVFTARNSTEVDARWQIVVVEFLLLEGDVRVVDEPRILNENSQVNQVGPSVAETGRLVSFIQGVDNELFILDLVSGSLQFVTDGVREATLSADGLNLFFVKQNLVTDKNEIWVYDVPTGRSRPIYHSDDQTKVWGHSISVSRNGRFVSFLSSELLDSGTGFQQVFLYDRVLRKVASTTSFEAKVDANQDVVSCAISADGDRVAFVTAADNLSDMVTDNDSYHVYTASVANLFDDGGVFLASAENAADTPFSYDEQPALMKDGAWLATTRYGQSEMKLDLVNLKSGRHLDGIVSEAILKKPLFTEERLFFWAETANEVSGVWALDLNDFEKELVVSGVHEGRFDICNDNKVVFEAREGGVYLARLNGDTRTTSLLSSNGENPELSFHGNCVAFIEGGKVHYSFEVFDRAKNRSDFWGVRQLKGVLEPVLDCSLSLDGHYVAVETSQNVMIFDLYQEEPAKVFETSGVEEAYFADSAHVLFCTRELDSLNVPCLYFPGDNEITAIRSDVSADSGVVQYLDGSFWVLLSTSMALVNGDNDEYRDVYLAQVDASNWRNSMRGIPNLAESTFVGTEDREKVWLPELDQSDYPDNGQLVFDILRQPDHGRVYTSGAGMLPLTFSPVSDFNGVDDFELLIADQHSDYSKIVRVDVEVRAVEDEPQWEVDKDIILYTGQTNQIDLRQFVNDPDVEDSISPDQLQFSLEENHPAIALKNDSFTLTVTSEVDRDALRNILLSVSDDGGVTKVPYPKNGGLEVVVRSPPVIEFNTGWNLVSFPVVPTEATLDAFFLEAGTDGPVWYWDNGAYKNAIEERGKDSFSWIQKGFWCYRAPASGYAEVEIERKVSKAFEPVACKANDWTLIGPVGEGETVNAFYLESGTSLWGWRNEQGAGYYDVIDVFRPDTIKAGKGYWFENELKRDVFLPFFLEN